MKHLFYLLLTLPLVAAEQPQPYKHTTTTIPVLTVPTCDLCCKSITYILHKDNKIHRYCAEHWIFGNDRLNSKPDTKGAKQ